MSVSWMLITAAFVLLVLAFVVYGLAMALGRSAITAAIPTATIGTGIAPTWSRATSTN